MEIQNAALKDPRPIEEKQKDFKHISGAVQLDWKELDLNNIISKLTSQRKQDGSFSCVFQSCASALEKLNGIINSALPYFWRKNYPEQGSYLQNALDIFYNRFTTKEEIANSQLLSEAVMNKIIPLTTFLGATGYRQCKAKSFEEFAEAVAAYGQCVACFESNHDEYYNMLGNFNSPKFFGTTPTFGHGICGQVYGLIKGVKVVVCRDSAVESGVTIISETFYKNRNTGAGYFLGAKDVSVKQDIPPVPILPNNPTPQDKSNWITAALNWLMNLSIKLAKGFKS